MPYRKDVVLIGPVERTINLALFLDAARAPVSAEQIRDQVNGYPPASEQDSSAFKRMFERDKERLTRIGLSIIADDNGLYRLDPAAFASPITFTDEEKVLMHDVALALSEDHTFPFADELRFALSKIIDVSEPTDAALSIQTTEHIEAPHSPVVGMLTDAAFRNKRVSFTYNSPHGDTARRDVEPYGVFSLAGQWYLVAKDISRNAIRTYLVSRMASVAVNSTRPKCPDFSMPDNFSVANHIKHPFQIGDENFEATLRFSPDRAPTAKSLTAGTGKLRPNADGTVSWQVNTRSSKQLIGWVVANGPGVTLVSPPDLAKTLEDKVKQLSQLHRKPTE